jgi:hypothetical protein
MKLISFCGFGAHALNRKAFNYYNQGGGFHFVEKN